MKTVSFIIDTCSMDLAATFVGKVLFDKMLAQGHLPMVPVTIVCEIFEGLAFDPTHRSCVSQCNLILEHWSKIQFLPDNAIGLALEYLDRPQAVSANLDWHDLKILKKCLESGAQSCFSSQFAQLRANTVSRITEGISAGQKEVLTAEHRQPSTWAFADEVAPGPARSWKTEQIVMGYTKLLGIQSATVDRSKRAKLGQVAWEDSKLKPYWSGLIRFTLFHDWFLDCLRPRLMGARAKGRTKPFPEEAEFERIVRDFYNLIPCMIADMVITEDKNLRKYGQKVAPQVRWLSFADASHELCEQVQ